jgi:hypothetical protein
VEATHGAGGDGSTGHCQAAEGKGEAMTLVGHPTTWLLIGLTWLALMILASLAIGFWWREEDSMIEIDMRDEVERIRERDDIDGAKRWMEQEGER